MRGRTRELLALVNKLRWQVQKIVSPCSYLFQAHNSKHIIVMSITPEIFEEMSMYDSL